MANPQFIEGKPLSLVSTKKIIEEIKKRDGELNYTSNKVNEYLDAFITLSAKQEEELYQKLVNLNLMRLKEEHFAKIIGFLPQNVNDLKITLQAYHLTLPKKDQENILKVVKEFVTDKK